VTALGAEPQPVLPGGRSSRRVPGPLRVAMVGVSEGPICGVRDYSAVVSRALEGRGGAEVMTCWLDRAPGAGLAASRREVRSWAARLEGWLGEGRPEVVLLHYSVFAYSYRGVPLLLAPVLGALRRSGVPVVALLHELAYPWGRRGARGLAWALTQRAALPLVLRLSSEVVVTTEDRLAWLGRRRWIAPVPAHFLPVPSNVDPGEGGQAGSGEEGVVGVFGYAPEGMRADLMVEAAARLGASGRPVRLRLVGAPGPGSGAAREWERLAAAAGVEVELTGVLDGRGLSAALRRCPVMVWADGSGPTSRRTTLAALLAHARAVVALDGPATWGGLREAGAVELVPPDASLLAASVGRLLAGEEERAAYGERAACFYRSAMAPEVVAAGLERVLRATARQGAAT